MSASRPATCLEQQSHSSMFFQKLPLRISLLVVGRLEFHGNNRDLVGEVTVDSDEKMSPDFEKTRDAVWLAKAWFSEKIDD